MRATILLAAALLLGSSISGIAHDETPDADRETIKLSDTQVEAGHFAVTDAKGGVLEQHISVPGSIIPNGDRIARVAVRLLGTVSELRKQLGDHVDAGEVVAVIESREVAEAKSEYLAARLVFDLQQTLFDRAKNLFDRNVLSENDYLRARTTYQDARVKIETARQKLFALSLTAEQIEALPNQTPETLRQQELRAPISGRIAERRTELGALVGREGLESELYVIVDTRILWADLAVPLSDLPSVREGGDVRIVQGQEAFSATIRFISPLIDSTTRAARVVASVDNTSGALRPGMFVTADIPTARVAARVLVPKTALQTLNGSQTVFVRTPNGFSPRTVTIGRVGARDAEVLSGLDAGERFASTNTFVLKAELGKGEADHH
ncbi:MAG: efflux RND transporter periplasmic adaptor subunit [Rhizobiales bacterium]|nr:efflux RND transporter periplasmic adaptor subunit [Hyphomicrobiales bacterium]